VLHDREVAEERAAARREQAALADGDGDGARRPGATSDR
jgi:hypothetical protein